MIYADRSTESLYAQAIFMTLMTSARSSIAQLNEATVNGTPSTVLSPQHLIASMEARILEGLSVNTLNVVNGQPTPKELYASNFVGDYTFPNVNALKRINAITDSTSRMLPIMTSIATLEGEGPEIGKPTLMTRIGGCAVKCKGCDTPFSWTANSTTNTFDTTDMKHLVIDSVMDVADLADLMVKQADLYGLKRISITGGEPLHYIPALRLLIADLWLRGMTINLETSGVIFDPIIFALCHISIDIKTPSSRVVLNDTQKGALHAVASYLNSSPAHVKAVILDRTDFDFILTNFVHIVTVGQGRYRPICLTPWAETTLESLDIVRMSSNVKDITGWILDSKDVNTNQVRVIGQQHKTLGFE